LKGACFHFVINDQDALKKFSTDLLSGSYQKIAIYRKQTPRLMSLKANYSFAELKRPTICAHLMRSVLVKAVSSSGVDPIV
jgi:hypothetical protein